MKKIFLMLITVFLCSGLYSYAYRQEKSWQEKSWIEVSKLNFEEKRGNSTSALVYQTTGGSSQTKQWAEISSTFSNHGDWIDNLKIRFLVLLMNKKPEVENKRLNLSDYFKLLSKDEEFVNVPQGKDFISKVYIHPHTLARFGEVAQIRVEVYRNGALDAELTKDFTTTKEKKKFDFRDWWKRFPLLDGSLLSGKDTPFMLEAQSLAKKIE